MHTDPMPLSARSRSPRSSGARPAAPQRLQMTSAGLTDPGLVRSSNEDRYLIAALSEATGEEQGYLFAVADGVGGAWGGETASALAIESIEQSSLRALRAFCARLPADGSSVATELRALFRRADLRLAEEVARRPALKGMGTTLTTAVCLGRRLFVAHAGDSRCYLLRDGALRQLTDDQTVPAELVRLGLLAPEAAADHAFRNVLTDFVGGGESRLHVEVREHELHGGNVVLVCSDGLTGMVSDDAIRSILLSAPAPERACRRLVARANEMGGVDNVTAVVARAAPVP
jgi:PPM family protein phosphatase